MLFYIIIIISTSRGDGLMEKRISSALGYVTIILIMVTVVFFYTNKDTITSVNKLKPISEVKTNYKVVAIACNVYEGNEELKKMVAILKEENVKISFFIGGIWAYRNPEMLLMLKNYGHDLQNHGYYHKNTSTLSKQKNITEIKDTEKLIYNITHNKTTLFEPPSGDYDDSSLNIINELGYKAITWSIDTIDWRDDASEDKIIQRISNKLHPGAIILMHPKPVTAEALGNVIKLIKGRGYRIVTVKSLLNFQN